MSTISLKRVFLWCVVAVVVVVGLAGAEPVLKYAGDSDSVVDTYVLPVSNSDGTCSTASKGNKSPYQEYTINFPSNGVREVAAMAEKSFRDIITIYVYSGDFDPSNPCTNLLRGRPLAKRFSTQGGPVVDDFVYFSNTTTYHFVITGTSTAGGQFAMNIFPSNATGSLTNGANMWLPPVTSSSYCSPDNGLTPAAIYSWIQPTTGFFDVLALFDNSSVSSFQSYLAVYAGNPNISDSCNAANVSSFALLVANTQSNFGVFSSYVSLTAGITYTAVLSGDDGQVAYWGIQVIPTRLRFLKASPAWVQPNHLASVTSLCSQSSNSGASWDSTVFTAEHSVYFIDTGAPPPPFDLYTTDTWSFLYLGTNDASPPATCPIIGAFVYDGDTGDVAPLYARTVPGRTYTAVVSTWSGGLVPPNSPYVLYMFTGDANGGGSGAVSVVVAPLVLVVSAVMLLIV